MKKFDYTIQAPLGLHARPAGLLAKEVRQFASVCTIEKGGERKRLTQLMMVMAMGIQQGDTVTVAAEGPDEDAAIEALNVFFQTNL